VKIWFTRRALVLHLVIAIVVPTFIGLWWWQWHAALAGNELSWAYTFEWPIFTGYAIFVWWKLVHQQPGEQLSLVPRQPRDPRAVNRPVGWALAASTKDSVSAPGTDPAPATAALLDHAPIASTGDASTGDASTTVDLDPAGGEVAGHPEQRRPGAGEATGEPEEDPELAAYNEYLAALAASGRRKHW
jgi:hypothetical protein